MAKKTAKKRVVQTDPYLDRLSISVIGSSHGDESPMFEVLLLLDGKKIAYVYNEGRGGMSTYDWFTSDGRTDQAIIDEFDNWIRASVDIGILPRFEPTDTFIYALLDEYDEQRAGCATMTRLERFAEYVKALNADGE